MWRVLQVQQLELHDLKKQLRSQNKRIDVHENKVQETADIAKSAKQSTESLSEYLHWKTW